MFNPFKSKSSEDYMEDLLRSILNLRKEEARLKESAWNVGMRVKTYQGLIKQASVKGDYSLVRKLEGDKQALMNEGRGLWEEGLKCKSKLSRLESTYKELSGESRSNRTTWSNSNNNNDSLDSKFWDLEVEEELQSMKRRVRVS